MKVRVFTEAQHREALIQRRIKFVVEKGAMARLFKRGTHEALRKELTRRVKLGEIASLQTRNEYDSWLLVTVESNCWRPYSRNGLSEDRWGYFAKLVNIVVYELVANREIFAEADWKRVRPFLHVPIDSKVTRFLEELDDSAPTIEKLVGMGREQYLSFQVAVRRLADAHGVPPIWFEAAWSV